ncbi:hypothetical protein [Jiella pacifica]|uniref:Uncharacterized protein n=1 Tax=Jiella pacifica TaxID=2696469 RepID=A0A6N9T514_9HYPH|nr:hypothetical protein [Jiella pacifica]NDW06330.1 hypothetical protein [Jiella pacifica]
MHGSDKVWPQTNMAEMRILPQSRHLLPEGVLLDPSSLSAGFITENQAFAGPGRISVERWRLATREIGASPDGNSQAVPPAQPVQSVNDPGIA